MNQHFTNIKELPSEFLPLISAQDWYEWAGERYISKDLCKLWPINPK